MEGWSSAGRGKWGVWLTCESKRCHLTPQLGLICAPAFRLREKALLIKLWNKRPTKSRIKNKRASR